MSCPLPDPPRANPNRPAQTMRWPAWMDARYMMVSTRVQYTDFTITAADGLYTVAGSATRWGIGFCVDRLQGRDITVFPDPTTNRYFWQQFDSNDPLIFTVSDYGPMPTLEWGVRGTLGTRVRLIEYLLNGG